ncbi:MAG: cupin domain-containing protein [Pseudomonadota bacterium]
MPNIPPENPRAHDGEQHPGPAEKDVGQRLADARRRYRVSQRKLARMSGVANATISQIESGALNPTVGTLKRIVSTLPMTLSEFFDDVPPKDDKVFFSVGDLVRLSEGPISYRQIAGGNKAIQFMWEKYEPGAATGKKELSHQGEECGFIVSGELTVTVSGEQRTLKVGEGYYFDSSRPHSFRNDGSIPCELITACTPASF